VLRRGPTRCQATHRRRCSRTKPRTWVSAGIECGSATADGSWFACGVLENPSRRPRTQDHRTILQPKAGRPAQISPLGPSRGIGRLSSTEVVRGENHQEVRSVERWFKLRHDGGRPRETCALFLRPRTVCWSLMTSLPGGAGDAPPAGTDRQGGVPQGSGFSAKGPGGPGPCFSTSGPYGKEKGGN